MEEDMEWNPQFDSEAKMKIRDEKEQLINCEWREISTMKGVTPPLTSGMSCVQYEGYVYIFGGFGGHSSKQQAIDSLYRFDTFTSTWTDIKAFGQGPKARTSHSMVIDRKKGVIYIMLGSGSRFGYSNYDDLFAYDILYRRWSRIQLKMRQGEKITGRYGHTSVFHSGCIYIFGGCFGRSLSDEMFCVNVKTKIVRRLAPGTRFPQPRYKHCMVKGGSARNRCNGNSYQPSMSEQIRGGGGDGFVPSSRWRKTVQKDILVLYGGCSERQAMNDTWIFDPETDLWEDITQTANELTAPRRCFAHTMVNVNGRLIVHGGTDAWSILQDVYEMDTTVGHPSKWRWRKVTDSGPVPPARYFHVMTALPDNSILIWGGKGSITHPHRFNDMFLGKIPNVKLSNYAEIPKKNGGRAEEKEEEEEAPHNSRITNDSKNHGEDDDEKEEEDAVNNIRQGLLELLGSSRGRRAGGSNIMQEGGGEAQRRGGGVTASRVRVKSFRPEQMAVAHQLYLSGENNHKDGMSGYNDAKLQRLQCGRTRRRRGRRRKRRGHYQHHTAAALASNVLSRDMLKLFNSGRMCDVEFLPRTARSSSGYEEDYDDVGNGLCNGYEGAQQSEQQQPRVRRRVMTAAKRSQEAYGGSKRVLVAILQYIYTDDAAGLLECSLLFLIKVIRPARQQSGEVFSWALRLSLYRLAQLIRRRIALTIRIGEASLLYMHLLNDIKLLKSKLSPRSFNILGVLLMFLSTLATMEQLHEEKSSSESSSSSGGSIYHQGKISARLLSNKPRTTPLPPPSHGAYVEKEGGQLGGTSGAVMNNVDPDSRMVIEHSEDSKVQENYYLVYLIDIKSDSKQAAAAATVLKPMAVRRGVTDSVVEAKSKLERRSPYYFDNNISRQSCRTEEYLLRKWHPPLISEIKEVEAATLHRDLLAILELFQKEEEEEEEAASLPATVNNLHSRSHRPLQRNDPAILKLKISKDRTVFVHKYILAARSAYFGCFSFISGMREAYTGKCDLTSTPFGEGALDLMIRYIYGGTAAVIRHCLESTDHESIRQGLEEVVASNMSDYFRLDPEFSLLCEQKCKIESGTHFALVNQQTDQI
eukprot:jgi/Bigna1/72960/fgenesh1_pg.22_\